MRQTNIVWVAGIFGALAVNTMIAIVYPKVDIRETGFEHLFNSIKLHLQKPRMLAELIFKIIKSFYGYILVILSFLLFLYINGSIVGE